MSKLLLIGCGLLLGMAILGPHSSGSSRQEDTRMSKATERALIECWNSIKRKWDDRDLRISQAEGGKLLRECYNRRKYEQSKRSKK